MPRCYILIHPHQTCLLHFLPSLLLPIHRPRNIWRKIQALSFLSSHDYSRDDKKCIYLFSENILSLLKGLVTLSIILVMWYLSAFILLPFIYFQKLTQFNIQLKYMLLMHTYYYSMYYLLKKYSDFTRNSYRNCFNIFIYIESVKQQTTSRKDNSIKLD